MEVKINIPEYTKEKGFKFEWEQGFEIESKLMNSEILISANKAGLISLAKHLLELAQDEIRPGYHLHLDENNSLEDGSLSIIIQKK